MKTAFWETDNGFQHGNPKRAGLIATERAYPTCFPYRREAEKLPASCELLARTLTEEQLWLSCPEYKGTITYESGR